MASAFLGSLALRHLRRPPEPGAPRLLGGRFAGDRQRNRAAPARACRARNLVSGGALSPQSAVAPNVRAAWRKAHSGVPELQRRVVRDGASVIRFVDRDLGLLPELQAYYVAEAVEWLVRVDARRGG